VLGDRWVAGHGFGEWSVQVVFGHVEPIRIAGLSLRVSV
jgi:hypothetical protein